MDEEGVECCKKGFHACENPMDVFEYYFIGENGESARFCEVEQSGIIDKGDEKQASSEIKIKAEIKFADFVKLAVNYMKKKVFKAEDSGGDSARIASGGDYAQIASEGCNSVIMCAGAGSRAKAKKGSWITLTEWDYNDKDEYTPVCVKTEYVDGERIKEDTWYVLENGEFKAIEL